uniref:Ribosomal protein L16 n=1 Tax=Wildemania schizophylla TaxID=1134705 RepID=A0A068F149_WILSC|nr:ribosomal protein L16 [Wildemania schizophylla]AID57265.1 ribosomal protein L16 [Wildemania schizophylla]
MKKPINRNNLIKQHKPLKASINQTNHILKRGQFGLRSSQHARVNVNQINNFKKFIYKEIKLVEKKSTLGKIKIWFCMFPTRPLTKLSPETRMGKGKGPIVDHCCYLRPGKLLFELANFPRSKASEFTRRIRNVTSFKFQSLLKFN